MIEDGVSFGFVRGGEPGGVPRVGSVRAVVRLRPRAGEHNLRTEDVVAFLESEGGSAGAGDARECELPDGAVVRHGADHRGGEGGGVCGRLGPGARRGECADASTRLGRRFRGVVLVQVPECRAGAVAGCFVHEEHGAAALPRFAGWWGNDPATRFKMGPEFAVREGADGWQLLNPPIFSTAPVIAGDLRPGGDGGVAGEVGEVDGVHGVAAGQRGGEGKEVRGDHAGGPVSAVGEFSIAVKGGRKCWRGWRRGVWCAISESRMWCGRRRCRCTTRSRMCGGLWGCLKRFEESSPQRHRGHREASRS